MKNSVFIAQNDRVQASPYLCTVTNTAHTRAYNKIFDISKPAYEIFSWVGLLFLIHTRDKEFYKYYIAHVVKVNYSYK